MNLREIRREAIDRYFDTLRLPIRVAERFGVEPNPALDKSEAAVRGLIARVLRDEDLAADARRISEAADARVRAARLRVAAAEHANESDEELQARRADAERLRVEAEQRAEEAEAQTRRAAQARKAKAADKANRKLKAVEDKAEADEEFLDGAAVAARMEELDREAEALEAEMAASRQRRTATALADATEAAKERRKRS